jgi:carbohydrate esterase-like sialic acid-specific acetylesterase
MDLKTRVAVLLAAMCGTPVWAQRQSAPPPKEMELFLLIGQSNMAGRGVVEAQDREALPAVWTLNKDLEWTPAVDPLHSDKPEIAGVGIGRSFAKALIERNPGRAIGLVPCAFGGTSLDQWKPGGELYTSAVKRARAAMKAGRLRGILWHQGEADSNDEAKARSYVERFGGLIRTLREDVGAPDVPLVAGQLGEFFQAPFAGVVNEQLALIAVSVRRAGFVPSGGLVHKGDRVHFDSPSLREFGRRYAMAFLMLDAEWGR